MELTLRFGRQGLRVCLPEQNVRHVLRMNPLPVLADPKRAVEAALKQPVGTPSLAEIAVGRKDAVIVVSDITRPVPNAVILPPLLETLAQAGLPPKRVTILVATGLHRGNTAQELQEMLGEEVCESGCHIINHEARQTEQHLYLGHTPRSLPVYVDRRYVEADLKILTGLIEPHLMAGYSGGRKAICPGLCSAETILAWHSPHMLAAKEACAGNLWRNPVHEEALAIADMAGGADFIVNVVLNEARQLTGVFAGDMRLAHIAGMELAEKQCKVALSEPVDIVVTSAAGYPLDLTFYQGIKGIVGALPIVKPGGSIIIAQENAEGIGGPEFTKLILSQKSLHAFTEALFAGKIKCIDQWQLQELAQACERANVYSISSLPADLQRRLFVQPAPCVEDAVAEAMRRHGPRATMAVIPEGPYVLACLQEDIVGSRSVRQMEEDRTH